MKLSKFTVILAVLLISIMAIGAVSAESVDDSGAIAIDDGGDVQGSIADDVGDLSTADNADLTVNDEGGAVLGDGATSYDLDDDSYSKYFNDDGTAKETLSPMGDYSLNVGTLNNKDIKITSGSNIIITAKENGGIINNGTIFIGDGTGAAGSITISGLTFTNTNKNAVDIADLSSIITINGNKMNIEGIAPEDNPYFSVYGVNANGYISGLNVEDNNITVTGNAPYSYGIQLGSYGASLNPENIVVSGNKIDLDIAEGANMGEAIYLDNPFNASVSKNIVTVKTVGDVFAYGIQIADSAPWTMWDPSYDGQITSARNVLISENEFYIDSEYMIYGISALDSGYEDWELICFASNITISNNTLVANSTRGVMGIAGRSYNITIADNNVTVTGGSAEGLVSSDDLGVGSYALVLQYNGDGADEFYGVTIENNNVTSNVAGEYINSEMYLDNVTFANEITYLPGTFLITPETYFSFFDETGNLKVSIPEGSTFLLGDLVNKTLDINTPVVINALNKDSLLNNTVIKLEEGADGSVISGLNMEFTGDENSGGFAVISAFEVSNIVIANNTINIPDSAGYGYAMAIEVEGLVSGCDNVIISGNTIDFKGSTAGMYGIDVFTKWKSEAVNTNFVITDNVVNIEGATAMAEPIYLNTVNGAVVANNTLTSNGGEGADAYGVGAPSANNVVFDNNKIVAKGTNMAYGISNTNSENVTIKNNDITAQGVGAIGVGIAQGTNIEVNDNKISVKGGDYTTISTWDSVGTGNGAIFVADKNSTVKSSGNDVTMHNIATKITSAGKTYLATASNKAITATLKDANGKALANTQVTFTVNGKTYKATTNANGVATVKLALTAAKTYTVSIKYAGNSIYDASTVSVKVKLNKEKTKITAPKKTFKRTVKTKKVVITLKNSKGKAIAKKKVTLTVNKKKYTVKTNKKGKATFKVKNLKKKGTFKYTVKFAGDSQYKAVKKTGKIKVK